MRISTRSAASRLDSGSSNRKMRRLAHDGAADRDALALAAGELARLALRVGVDAQQLARPASTRCGDFVLRRVPARRSA